MKFNRFDKDKVYTATIFKCTKWEEFGPNETYKYPMIDYDGEPVEENVPVVSVFDGYLPLALLKNREFRDDNELMAFLYANLIISGPMAKGYKYIPYSHIKRVFVENGVTNIDEIYDALNNSKTL